MSGLATELWNMGHPKVPAASATAAQAAGSNRSMLPIGASATGIAILRPRKVELVSVPIDVTQHARTERQRIEREAVAAQGGLGLGAADQIIPDVAVELRACHRDKFVQVVELLADMVDARKRLCSRDVVHCRVIR